MTVEAPCFNQERFENSNLQTAAETLQKIYSYLFRLSKIAPQLGVINTTLGQFENAFPLLFSQYVNEPGESMTKVAKSCAGGCMGCIPGLLSQIASALSKRPEVIGRR